MIIRDRFLRRLRDGLPSWRGEPGRVERLTRARTLHAGCSRALAHAENEGKLLQEMCRIAVESGGYAMAWVGTPLHDESRSINPVAHAGRGKEYFDHLQVSWGEDRAGLGPTGNAIRTRRTCVSQDITHDPAMAPWRVSALKLGFASVVSLPLIDHDDCLGILVIYACEPFSFDDNEIGLLEELAADIAYGVSALRARGAQAQAEERFRATFEHAAVGIAHTSLDGRYLLVNRKFCDMVGYSADELVGRASIVSHPDDRGMGAELRRQLIESKLENFSQEKRYVRKDGAVIWINRTVSLARDAAGAALYFIRVIEDISERKHIEQESRVNISERKHREQVLKKQNALRVLLESLAVAANQATTPEQALRVCLSRLCSYGGWPIGHVLMFGDAEFSLAKRTSIWHLSDAERWAEFRRISDPLVLRSDGAGFVNRVIAGRRPLWVKDIADLGPFRRGEVARRLGLKSAFAFPVVVGQQVVAYLEFFSDEVAEPDEALLDVTTNIGAQLGRVVERGLAESALRQSEEHFRGMVNQAGVGITQVSLDGHYMLVNDKYCEIVGYSRDELATMTTRDIISPMDYEQAAALRARLLSGAIEMIRAERRTRRKSGGYAWVNVSTSLVRTPSGAPKLFISVIEDISERKRTEAALYESEEQFDQLANNIPQMFWITGVAQREVVYLSRAFEQITGYTIEEAKASSRVLVAMVHPDDRRRVQTARKNAAQGGYDETFRLLRPDNTVRWVHDRAFPIRDVNGQAYRIAGITEDITERKQAEERMLQLAHYDRLTNLPNRVLCYDRLKQALAQATRNHWGMALMFVDVDRFKNINDTLGHSTGDALLQQASERLARCIRAGDTVGRSGGDEYMLVLSNLNGAADAGAVAQMIMAAFAEPFMLDGNPIYVTVSIGIALYPGDSKDQDELLRDADTAMYRAKELGRNNFQFYQASMNAKALDKLNLENGLRRALEHHEFRLFYQPKANLVSGEITGFEALLRWQHPDRGLIPPVEFIPLLEETGLIVQAGEWVIRAASAQLKAWRDAGITPAPIAVNLSARQFQSPDLGPTIIGILDEFDIEPELLELEITESSLMHNTEEAVRTVEYLVSLGLRISIDDFGTGYSSLAYLKRFPLDALKIDRTFVKDIGQDSDDTAITLALISLAHNLGLKVVAEGVETEGQRTFLSANGCDEMQGYYFARPLPADECTEFLRHGSRLPQSTFKSESQETAILLVDDDDDALQLIKHILSNDNYRILTATSARMGLQLLSEHHIKVVVSDQQMPGMNGVEFLRHVKLLHPHAVRIMLSGQTEFETVTDAVNQGEIYRFLAKNWTKDQLRKEIREACAAGNGMAKGGTKAPPPRRYVKPRPRND